MKTLTTINWIIISLYILILGFFSIKGEGSGMDAAGKSLSQAYLIATGVFLLILTGLNLIPVKWVKVLTLILGIVPPIFLMVYNYESQATLKEYEEELKKAQELENTQLNVKSDSLLFDLKEIAERN